MLSTVRFGAFQGYCKLREVFRRVSVLHQSEGGIWKSIPALTYNVKLHQNSFKGPCLKCSDILNFHSFVVILSDFVKLNVIAFVSRNLQKLKSLYLISFEFTSIDLLASFVQSKRSSIKVAFRSSKTYRLLLLVSEIKPRQTVCTWPT